MTNIFIDYLYQLTTKSACLQCTNQLYSNREPTSIMKFTQSDHYY